MNRSVIRSGLTNGRWYKSMLAGGVSLKARIAGYFAGGYEGVSVVKSATKLAYANDTRSTITNALTDPTIHPSGFANSGIAGYLGGGSAGTVLSRVNKLSFPGDTLSTLATGLSSAGMTGAAMANSGVAGYQAIGDTTGGTNFVSTVDKFAFPGDTRTTLGTGLSGARGFFNAMANVAVAGYFMGGRVTPFAYISTVDKFAFPGDTRTTLGTGLSANNGAQAGFANAGVAGYSAGGVISDGRVDKFAFPSDTRSTLATGMSVTNYWVSGVASSGEAGYAGCAGIGGSPSANVDKFAFPSDTRSTLTSILTHATSGHGSSFSNEGIF